MANIYLHYVLDDWFETVIQPQLQGRAKLVRYADDFVIACTNECDAIKLFSVLPQRFAEYGLTVHTTKSRLVRFTRPRPGRLAPETFDLLGFTWYWGQTQTGYWTVKTRTASDRINRTIQMIDAWCKRYRHKPIPEQCRTLRQKLQGHYAYYGRPGNYDSLSRVYQTVIRCWHRWLSRRSWTAYLTWDAFYVLLEQHALPSPRISRRC